MLNHGELESWQSDKLIDFNGISTCLGLFYDESLGNHICIFSAVVAQISFFGTVLSNTNNFYTDIYIYMLECSPMARESWVQSQVESYQRLKKMVLDASLLNTQHYKVRIKGKVEQSREGVAPSPTHWCSSYQKGSLQATLDYGRQLYFYFYIYKKIEPQIREFFFFIKSVFNAIRVKQV